MSNQRELIEELATNDRQFSAIVRLADDYDLVCYIQRYHTKYEAEKVINGCYVAYVEAAKNGRDDFACEMGDISTRGVIGFEVAKTARLWPIDHPNDLLVPDPQDTDDTLPSTISGYTYNPTARWPESDDRPCPACGRAEDGPHGYPCVDEHDLVLIAAEMAEREDLDGYEPEYVGFERVAAGE